MVTALERWESKVDKTESCWIWTAAMCKRGYGSFWYNGQMRPAYRVGYELLVGPIPKGLELDHLCRNPSCVNPDHLEPVTHKVNMSRGEFAMKTHCPKGHPYSGHNLKLKKNGGRDCRACHAVTNNRARDQRRKVSV